MFLSQTPYNALYQLCDKRVNQSAFAKECRCESVNSGAVTMSGLITLVY